MFIEKLIQSFSTSDSKPVKVKLVPCKIEEGLYNKNLIQAAVGNLFTKTHSDIAFAVSSIAQFSARPIKEL